MPPTFRPASRPYPTSVRARERFFDLLRRAQGVSRLERELTALRGDLGSRFTKTESQLETIEARTARLETIEATTAATRGFLTGEIQTILRSIASEDAENRRRLWEARADPAYERPFSDPEPLVSVVIPTFNRPQLLQDRSLPSVLSQGYERIEVLVVGDHAKPEVGQVVAEMSDPRLSFHNLTQRLAPRRDSRRQWYVQSVMARNEGFRLAQGSWVVTFDDDDLMHQGAIGRLLEAARAHRAEVAYGRFRMVRPDGTQELGEFPPEHGRFTWQSGICHARLSFFERELFAADFDQPNDYFLAEAMLRAGVRFAMIQDLICDLYPSADW